jgi:hypothetical protein
MVVVITLILMTAFFIYKEEPKLWVNENGELTDSPINLKDKIYH